MVAHFLYCALLPDNVRVSQLLQKGYFSDSSGRNSLTLPGEITVVDMIQVTPVQPMLVALNTAPHSTSKQFKNHKSLNY